MADNKSGRIYLSMADEKDQFKVIAHVMMMADGLLGGKTSDKAIESALARRGLDVTPENVAKVKAHFKEPAREPALAAT